jgi:HK97 family phage portal protein
MSRRYSSAQKQAQVLRRRVERQEKVNPLYAGYSVISDMSQPRTMSRDIRTYINEGYCGNDTLNKVIGYGITNGAAIPPVLFTDRTMKKRINNHPILDKLENPNSEMDGVFYRECVLGWFLLAGSSFMYINRVAKAGPPDEMWVLESNKVKPIPDEKRGITGYEYADFPAEKNPIKPNLIGHMRNWNPRDPFFGLSPITVAAILVDQQSAIRKWNLALLQNFAKPPGAWVTDAILAPNDRAKLEARVNEKLTGFRNAGKTPVLDGALKWMPSAVSPADMDWLESTKYNAGAIANVFNMPPQLIGDTSSTTFDNMQEAKAASYTEYIFPMLDKEYSTLRRWLVPMYPDLCDRSGKPVAYLYYDKESVEVVQAVIQARKTAASQRANQSWSQGAASSCTLNEAREMQGLPPDPQGDIYRIGGVYVRKTDLDKYAEQSLTVPAAPPMPIPEPIEDTGNPSNPSNPNNTQDDTQPANGTKPTPGKKPNATNPGDSNSGNSKPGNKPAAKPASKPKSREIGDPEALDLTSKQDKDTNRAVEVERERWTDDASERIDVGSNDEKRIKRENYRKFMDEVLV